LDKYNFQKVDKFLVRAVLDTLARLNHRPNLSYRGSRPTAKGWPSDLGLRDVVGINLKTNKA
jgi:hypothetical protein